MLLQGGYVLFFWGWEGIRTKEKPFKRSIIYIYIYIYLFFCCFSPLLRHKNMAGTSISFADMFIDVPVEMPISMDLLIPAHPPKS
jgi:hypothetical protein